MLLATVPTAHTPPGKPRRDSVSFATELHHALLSIIISKTGKKSIDF